MADLAWLIFMAFIISCIFVGIKRVFGTGKKLVNKAFDKIDKWLE